MMHGGFSHMRNARMGIDEAPPPPKGLWKRVVRFSRPHMRKIIGYLLTIAATSATTILPAILIERFIKLLTPIDAFWTSQHRAPPDVAQVRAELRIVLIGFVVVPLLNSFLALVTRWLSSSVGEGVIFDLRAALFQKVQRMPIAFFSRTQTGALISRLQGDVVGAQGALTNTLGSVVSNVLTALFVTAAMLSRSPGLTLVALAAVPFFILPAKKMAGRVSKLTRAQMNENSGLSALMTERFNVSGALLVKLFGDRDTERKDFSDRAGRVRDLGVKMALLFRIYALLLGTVTALATALIYFLGSERVLGGSMQLGQIVAFGLLVVQLYGPINGLASSRADIAAAFVSFDRVFEVLDLPELIEESPTAIDAGHTAGHLVFDNVRFRYPTPEEIPIGSLEAKPGPPIPAPDTWVLDGLSFEITPGKMVALVGASGAGKTTLSALASRLYDPTEGRITLDGNDLRALTLASIKDTIGVVSQDAHLFHTSLRDNLLYARPTATEEEMIDACKAAQIHELVSSLPSGYDTVVGERGYRLSGGEKQRIAIARVLIKNPSIVILDEATAHLDSTNEALIQRALAVALEGRSSLVIAHRLSTIVRADEILVLKQGKIAERGRHEDLVNAGGLYSTLYETQFTRVETV